MGIRKAILPIGLAVILVFVMATAPMIVSTPAFAQITITPGKNVLSIEAGSPTINKINPDTGATISSVVITLDASFPEGLTINGGTGIDFNPDDGKIYALLKLSTDPDSGFGGGTGGGLTRHLVTIDLQTGVATLIGDTGVKKIASLTFNPGTLYSVKLGSSDNTLSTISSTGVVTTLCDLDVGFGTGLAHNPDDGFLYYATGGKFQRIDDFTVDPCVVTDIPTALTLSNPEALTFFSSFLISNFDGTDQLSSIDALGAFDPIGSLDHFTRGLTVIPVSVVGGELIPLDSTMILVAGAQYNAAWMIPVIISAIGIGIVIARKF